MGGKECYCIRNPDPKSLTLQTEEKVDKKPTTPVKNQLSVKSKDTYKKYEKQIITIQAWIRGCFARKHFENPLKKKSTITSNRDGGPSQFQCAREISSIPDYSNTEAKLTAKKIGAFIYDQPIAEGDKDLIERGPIELADGTVYVGQWNRNGFRHGKGVNYWPDGSKYEGYWANGKANGKGRLIHSDGDFYEGNWVNDKAEGKGSYSHVDGAYYEGSWKDDKQHGQGLEGWQDGARYEGEFNQGKKHGKGSFKWSDGSCYEGNFVENNIQGKGIYIWADGRRYEGDWKENMMCGYGIFTWRDGRKYEGEYINDKKAGKGIFSWPDGRKYDGNWSDGKQHGIGWSTSIDGTQRQGEWQNGKRVRWIDSSSIKDHKNGLKGSLPGYRRHRFIRDLSYDVESDYQLYGFDPYFSQTQEERKESEPAKPVPQAQEAKLPFPIAQIKYPSQRPKRVVNPAACRELRFSPKKTPNLKKEGKPNIKQKYTITPEMLQALLLSR